MDLGSNIAPTSTKNQLKKSLAINEVSVLRQSRQAANLSVYSGKQKVMKRRKALFKLSS